MHIERERQVRTAQVEQAKAVEVATRDQQIAVAQKEAERAAAEKAQLEAEAAREAANQQVKTVEVRATAEREAQQKLIAAENQAQMALVQQQRAADAAAYQRVKEAEAEQLSAVRQAEARLKLAEAEALAKAKQAEGETAIQMVPVNVSAKQVEVERMQVEVDRQSAEYKQQYERAAIDFELKKLEVQKMAEVQVAMAGAIGQFMQQGKFTLFGDPETMSNMMGQFVRGMGINTMLEGLAGGLNGSGGDGAGSALTEVAGLVGQLVRKVTGDGKSNLDEEVVQRIVAAVLAELGKSQSTEAAAEEAAGPAAK